MERLLRYSHDHDRVIRLMLMDEDGNLSQVNARVTRYDADSVDFITTRSPRTVTVPRKDILAIDFRKGDDGQVLRKCICSPLQFDIEVRHTVCILTAATQ